MENDQIRHILSRLALAVILVGFGLWEIIQPAYWTAFVPSFLSGVAPAETLVFLHGIVLLVIGAAIFSGFYLRIASVLAALVMVEIIGVLLLESGFTDLIIRDVVVLLLALSLVFDETYYLRIRK